MYNYKSEETRQIKITLKKKNLFCSVSDVPLLFSVISGSRKTRMLPVRIFEISKNYRAKYMIYVNTGYRFIKCTC